MACEALFNTFCFLGLFLPGVVITYWATTSRRGKLIVLSVASLVFYSFWDARFTLLLIAASTVDFGIALAMGRTRERRKWLAASLLFNLGLLAIFKYAMFAAENARSLFDLLGIPIEIPRFWIVLPLGISFYTFQTLSYTIDVYRGDVVPTRDYLKYLAFVTAFPQLVAGPIVRYTEVSAQMDELPTRPPYARFPAGITLFCIGLFKKVVIADSIGALVDPMWTSGATFDAPTAWIAAVGFALQLYFDFSGYSEMAVGIGVLLGLSLPINFRAPLQAHNPSDFWRRWHISLSRFVRDYLYIPLGGNRLPLASHLATLIFVMLIMGIWHGAGWTFVLYGLYNGILLAVYVVTRDRWNAAPRPIQLAATLFFVGIGHAIWFRAPDVATAFAVWRGLFTPTPSEIWSAAAPALVGLALVLAFTLTAQPAVERRFDRAGSAALLSGSLLALSILFIAQKATFFLYYQF